jgi:hypothetical protein
MIPSALFTDSFTIKKTDLSKSNGRVTHKVSTVSIGNKGRFSDIGGSRSRFLIGSVSNVTKILYTEANCEIVFGRVIEDESDCTQYDIIRVDTKKFFGNQHHLQVSLEQRSTNIT